MRRLLYWSVYEQPFLTALLSSPQKYTFKLNKKKSRNHIEQAPTFKNASDVILEMKEKDFSFDNKCWFSTWKPAFVKTQLDELVGCIYCKS
jgi:hypothetical protein